MRSFQTFSPFPEIETLESRIVFSSLPLTPVENASAVIPTRIVENLGRGVTAVRSSSSQVLISWRLLALDPSTIGFNVYRSANNAPAIKLNASPLTTTTNYLDNTFNASVSNRYYVRPVINGVEQASSDSFTLPANAAIEPVVRIPLRSPGTGYHTRFVWVGDLDGDGEYDYVRDLLSSTGNSQKIEAYKRDGTFLWDVDLGPNSLNTDNIEPGSTAISVGNWDGVTVYDMDSDGKAEVLLRTANGVRFGNGTTLTYSNNNVQFISVLDGMTGAERARASWTNPYLADGPMGMMFTIGYLDGVHPSLLVKGKNRVGSGPFNMLVQAFQFNGVTMTQQWVWDRNSAGGGLADGHNIRAVDVDGDGKDEFADIGFVLNSDGTLRYSLGTTGGVVHGDRFYIGDFDPSRPGLEGYGIQQNNPSGLHDYYYDAATGQMIWQHFDATPIDVGRGLIADLDPGYPGAESSAFNGIWHAPTNTQLSSTGIWPAFHMHWDGDLSAELYNDEKIEQWNPSTTSVSRLVTTYRFNATQADRYPMMIADLFGDWREEAILLTPTQDQLVIFTTNQPTNYRFYTLAQNPLYRNNMTAKGYLQSAELDYYLGEGMSAIPRPNVVYAGTIPVQTFVFQAENAALQNVTIATNYRGYNGSGFVDFPSNNGILRFNSIPGGVGALTTLRFRYSLGASNARTGRLIVNGVEQSIVFSPTGGWSRWAVHELSVPLYAGNTNTIILQSIGQDLANIDELQIDAKVLPQPVLAGVVLNDGSTQRSTVESINVNFEQPVVFDLGAIEIRDRSGQLIPFNLLTINNGTSYKVRFLDSLPDGHYIFTLNGLKIRNDYGQRLGANYTSTFHRLFGDDDGDGDVDYTDFSRFRTSYGTALSQAFYTAHFDWDNDGDIDLLDFQQFYARYLNKTLRG